MCVCWISPEQNLKVPFLRIFDTAVYGPGLESVRSWKYLAVPPVAPSPTPQCHFIYPKDFYDLKLHLFDCPVKNNVPVAFIDLLSVGNIRDGKTLRPVVFL